MFLLQMSSHKLYIILPRYEERYTIEVCVRTFFGIGTIATLLMNTFSEHIQTIRLHSIHINTHGDGEKGKDTKSYFRPIYKMTDYIYTNKWAQKFTNLL